MRLHRSRRGIVVQAPAKLNLFFEVLDRRPDGYHEIETLVVRIDRYDTLWFAPRDDDRLALTCRRPLGFAADADEAPEGPQNLVVRAIDLLRRRAGIAAGAEVRLVKRIPSAAGLGGGSSDAAAALAAANVGWRLNWSWRTLAELGAELGSDVPLFFAPGAAICRGRGERVEPLRACGSLHFVIVRPPLGLSTAAVYGVCRPGNPPRGVESVRVALESGNLGKLGQALFNRLESAAEILSPWIARLRREFAQVGCIAAQLTGSGSCYFGLCGNARQARRAAGRLQARGVGAAMVARAVVEQP